MLSKTTNNNLTYVTNITTQIFKAYLFQLNYSLFSNSQAKINIFFFYKIIPIKS